MMVYMRKVLVLNGPNLNKLGQREPDVYGSTSLADIETMCLNFGKEHGLQVDFRQSNDEVDLINWLQEAATEHLAVVINPAAYTHTSVAIRDAASMVTEPLIEIHLSNPMTREEFRHTSLVSGVANGTIAGFGAQSYLLALRALLSM
jgi:3-dehydroquinate dehydratase-2